VTAAALNHFGVSPRGEHRGVSETAGTEASGVGHQFYPSPPSSLSSAGDDSEVRKPVTTVSPEEEC
jgi:hypothetical protein